MIWSSTLPHGSTLNLGSAPRLVQYVTMVPAAADQDENSRAEPVRGTFRSDRIELWESHLRGATHPAVLGLVARRIAGVEAWAGEQREGFDGLAADWRATDADGPASARL